MTRTKYGPAGTAPLIAVGDGGRLTATVVAPLTGPALTEEAVSEITALFEARRFFALAQLLEPTAMYGAQEALTRGHETQK